MWLVLDTNVVVSGLVWDGPPRRLIELAQRGDVTLFSTGVLLEEMASVLRRRKFAAPLALQGVSPEFVMQRYGALTTLVRPALVERAVPRDEDDDHVIAAAVSAHADAIVTGDGDLLELDPYRGIRILTPAAILARLGAAPA